MKSLYEVDYKDIFSPKTLQALKGKSGESYKQLIGNKSLMQAMQSSQRIMQQIIQAESEYRDELEQVAIQMVTDAYPIIDYANIKIEAKIIDVGSLDLGTQEDEEDEDKMEDPASSDFGMDDPEKLKAKRRIINGITQGASIRGAFGFMLFKEYLDAINPELVGKYNEILKAAFGIYDNDDAIAMMLAALEQKMNMQGGESEMEYDDETGQFIIKAQAVCFPMLVHEIVKGLYEIVGTSGFGADKAKNQAIVGAVDTLENEPEDLRYGKFIYDAITKLYNDNTEVNDPRIRELFFTEIYKMDDSEFFNFIENAINNELTPDQVRWAKNAMKDIESDLKKDDTGLEDLDELNVKKAIATGALALGLAGSPNTAKAQDKVSTPTTQQQDTAKTATATYTHPNENTARSQATVKARAALATKLGKPEGSISASVVDTKMYEINGKYECTVTVKLN